MNLPAAPSQIWISARDLERMRQDVDTRRQEEACGLLAGRVDQGVAYVDQVIPMRNALQSPVRYRLDPAEQIEAFDWIDAQELELVGIYHSHPAGPDGPSQVDISEAYYPQAVYWIWSGRDGEWRYAAFTIQGNMVASVEILIDQLE